MEKTEALLIGELKLSHFLTLLMRFKLIINESIDQKRWSGEKVSLHLCFMLIVVVMESFCLYQLFPRLFVFMDFQGFYFQQKTYSYDSNEYINALHWKGNPAKLMHKVKSFAT